MESSLFGNWHVAGETNAFFSRRKFAGNERNDLTKRLASKNIYCPRVSNNDFLRGESSIILDDNLLNK